MNTDNTNPDEHTPDVMRATLRGRLLLAVFVLLAGCLLAVYQFYGLPFLKAALGASAPAHAIDTIMLVLIGVMAVFICAGAYVIWYGKKISRQRQFPLPGAWVWRDTVIKRGRAAVRIAWLHYAVGALIAIPCIVFAVYAWIMLDRLAPQLKLPPGVTILQQRMLPGGK